MLEGAELSFRCGLATSQIGLRALIIFVPTRDAGGVAGRILGSFLMTLPTRQAIAESAGCPVEATSLPAGLHEWVGRWIK